jgi:hypothetical protein
MPYLGAKELKASDIRRFDVTGSTSATHTLTWTAPNEQSLIVTINGVKQHEDAYSVSGTTLTLTSALVSTDKLEVIGINDIGTTITPAQNSVDADKIADDAVTVAKLNTTGTASSSTFLRGDMAWASAGDEAQYFFASMTGSNQNVNDNTATKVNINTAVLDNKSGFNTTNNRFEITSDTAGIWKIGGQVAGHQITTSYLLRVFSMLYKNGSSLGDAYDSLHDIDGAFGLGFTTPSVTAIVSLSAGDYVELYGQVARSSGSGQNEIMQRGTNFYGFRVKAA